MIGNALVSIGGLLFAVLLLYVYSIKSKQTGINNKIFRIMVVLLVLVIISELSAVALIYYFPNNTLVGNIGARINALFTIIWTGSVCCYLVTLERAYQVDDLKKYLHDRIIRLILISYAFILIISFFFGFDNVTLTNGAYISGSALYYLYIVGLITVGFSILFVTKRKEKLSNINKVPIMIGIIETFITMVIQLAFPHILILTGSFVFKMYLVYFVFENPDLYLIKELEIAKKKADASNKAKTDFLSNMSHEIRTPMNAIMGFSEGILNEEKFDLEVAKKDIDHIYSAGTNLLEIINNILDISKIETGEEKIELKEYSIGNIVLELTSIIEARIDNSKVKFVTNIDPNIPSKLLGDKTKIFQILLNILSNSVKYTEVGKIELKITSEIKDNKALLHVKVSDTGYGIKKEDYNKLFEKFSRLESATKNEIEGTGLGLVITKRLVNLLGGNIWFESEYGAGTTFFVDLSQKIIDKSILGDILTKNISHKSQNYLDCSGYNVLLVDDNKLNLKVAEKVLQPYNFTITSMNSGKECIDSIKMGNKYDIIFLDHMMPEIDGIEVLHILHKLDGYDIPPVVALTANAITGMREMYINEGFDDYLSKPINTTELDKVIHKYFEKKRRF